jgi:hypothetical protein
MLLLLLLLLCFRLCSGEAAACLVELHPPCIAATPASIKGAVAASNLIPTTHQPLNPHVITAHTALLVSRLRPM